LGDLCDETGHRSAEEFASFFMDRVDVQASTSSTPIYDVPLRATLEGWTLTPVSPDEVEQEAQLMLTTRSTRLAVSRGRAE